MTKRVVLLSNQSLLAAGVQRLLQEAKNIELSIVATGDPEATAKLRKLSPWAIVLDSGDASIGDGAITQLLAEHPKTRVIGLNVNRAGIEVYRLKRVLQTDLSGLLEAIQGKGASPRRASAQMGETQAKQ